jgi:HlyD family secretion protein
MRVLADIDEADVGKVKEGMLAEVSVDAFAGDRFEGKLTQIRLSPNRVEGVVTYSAVILVDNPDAKLRPGMTATVRIETRKAEGVQAIRNAALRFEPLTPQREGASAPTPEEKPLSRLKAGQARVYLEGEGPKQSPGVKAQVVEVGISDGVWTELKEGLALGARPIVDEKPDESKKGFRLF